LLLSSHLFFEDHARLGFIEGQLMHLLLISCLMTQRSLPRLAIQGHMHMLLSLHGFVLSAGFVSASLQGPDWRKPLVHHLPHLLGIHRS
jgi:hypothetical protein